MGKFTANIRETQQAPRLSELFIPCPLCGGTTDIDFLGRAYCASCLQMWHISGEPVDEKILLDDMGLN